MILIVKKANSEVKCKKGAAATRTRKIKEQRSSREMDQVNGNPAVG
jgi:hypothetical protein